MDRKYQNMTQRYLIDLILQTRNYAMLLDCKVGEIELKMGRKNNSEVLTILSEAIEQLYEAGDKLREVMSRTEKEY